MPTPEKPPNSPNSPNSPTTKPSTPPDLLITFLHERDTPCPFCAYNLRNLTEPICPECEHPLELTVGIPRLRFGWFIAALAPWLFSGMAAVAIGIMLFVEILMRPPGLTVATPPPLIYLLCIIGLMSGAMAFVLIARRQRFIKQPTRYQRTWAIIAWLIHGLPYLGLIMLLIITA